MIRVIITDDHTVVRQGVRNMLGLASDIQVVGEAANGDELLRHGDLTGCDLLLLDISMPGTSGPELIQQVKARQPKLPILILSMHRDAQVAQSALRAGASGYITKDSDPKELIAAVRKVVGGGRYLNVDLAEQIAFQMATATPAGKSPLDLLSAREREVLTYITRGLTINEIASQLFLSPKTVSTHKTNLMQKLGIDNNAGLILFGVKHGLSQDAGG